MLPKSWANPPIGDCCDLNPKIDKAKLDDAQPVHFVPMPAVEALINKVDVSATRSFGEVKKGYTPFTSGDVIFAKITPCMENGKTAVVPELPHGIAFGSTEFHVVRPQGGLDPLWFFYFLSSRSFRSIAEHNMTGAVGQRRVPIDFIAKSTIPLPPLPEQKRIVAKIEELFSELEAGEESLRVARRQLGVYRQSLLKQAFEGKLTAQWRAQNPDKLESPASLLARIQSARQERYEQQFGEWEQAVRDWDKLGAAGRKPSKPTKPDSTIPVPISSNGDLPALPAAWCWLALEHVVATGPTNGYSPISVSYPTATKAITLTATTSGRFDGSHFKYIDEVFPPTSDLWLRDGDILIQRGNTLEYVGVPALYRGKPYQFIYPDLMMRLQLPSCVLPEFLTLAISDKRARNFMRMRAVGAAGSMPKINHATVRALPVPLCSLPEQQEIVRSLDAQFEVTERNEREIDAALKRSEALRQAILHRAFTGRLVPQDPTDEPASQLLARLRANSVSTPEHPKRRSNTPPQ